MTQERGGTPARCGLARRRRAGRLHARVRGGAAATTTIDGRRRRGTLTELGEGEGEVNLVAWAGYVEDGSTDPKVDWVTDFEKETGCKVNVKIGNTSDEMVQLMRTGQYDGVSASGDATVRLIEGGDVDPVNTDLIPNYADVFDAPQGPAVQHVDGQMYGVPHGRGSNLLMYDTDEVKPAPKSWDVVFDKADRVRGQGHGVRQPDLHRRRGAVPDASTSPTSGSRIRTSSTRSSSTPRSSC